MKNFMILTEAIRYIEQNLCEPVSRADIAKHCSVSLSMLEKLFHYALGFSIGRYITRRRMTAAAKDIAKSEKSITEIAMQYGFNSVEVFSRSFKRVWGVNPSEFSDKWKFTGIFPKINYEFKKGDDLYMARKRVDMSEAYDYLKEMHGSYVLCFDVHGLTGLNDVSTRLGDLAILEEAARIDKVATDDMLMLRIGGDEFALLTGLYEVQAAEAIKEAVCSQNGVSIHFEGKEYPLSLWCGMTVVPQALRYSEFFADMHETIENSKMR